MIFMAAFICVKRSRNALLFSVEFLRTEITPDPSNYHRQYSPKGLYSLSVSGFEMSDIISIFKTSIEYCFVIVKCLIRRNVAIKTLIS